MSEGDTLIEKKMRLVELYDFYGQLLTDKQQMIMESYSNDDLSLGEISENLSVSRQAVYDNLRRAEQTLEKYENKLNLMRRFHERQEALESVVEHLIELRAELKDNERILRLDEEITRIQSLLE